MLHRAAITSLGVFIFLVLVSIIEARIYGDRRPIRAGKFGKKCVKKDEKCYSNLGNTNLGNQCCDKGFDCFPKINLDEPDWRKQVSKDSFCTNKKAWAAKYWKYQQVRDLLHFIQPVQMLYGTDLVLYCIVIIIIIIITIYHIIYRGIADQQNYL